MRQRGTARLLCGVAAAALLGGIIHARPAAAAAPQSVELDEFRVRGNSVLPIEAIEEAVYPFLGPNRTAADVEAARAALAALYRARGYQTVSVIIPPQRVTNGVVYLQVVEQKIARLRVVGAHHVVPSVLKAEAPSLTPGQVPNFNKVKHDLARLNTLPDRTVTPTFRPGREPNTLDVDLAVADQLPLHGSLELDNRQSVGTPALRLSGQLSYDDFFQRGDTGSVFFQVAPTNDSAAQVVGGSYLFHIPDTILALYGSFLHTDSNVTTVGGLDVVGKGDIATVQVQVPLGLGEGFVHSFSASIAYKKLGENDVLGGGTAAASANAYPITYYPFSAAYEADFVGKASRTSFSATATFGLDSAGSGLTAFNNKRKYADQSFSYLRLNWTRTQELPRKFEFYISTVAQFSADALLSTEQLGIGGLDTVRGYYEDEALGDQGVAGQIELRSPSLAGYVSPHINQWRFHLFFDAGTVSIHRALVGQAGSYTLSSAGIGTRIQLFNYLNATLEDAFLLSRGPNSPAGENRVLFRIFGSF